MQKEIFSPHSTDAAVILDSFSVVPGQGLSDNEVGSRLEEYGLNKLKEEKGYSILGLIYEQFSSFLVIILIAAGVLSWFVGEHIDSIAIFLIVLVNGILGFIQEFKAEQSIEALKQIETQEALVIRDGEEIEISADQVVPGDIVLLTEGSKVPADARLLEVHSLMVDESMLTGESVPVSKEIEMLPPQTALAERKNLVFSGSLVTKGRGVAVVVLTGEQTEIGKIAENIQSAQDQETPLQAALAKLGRIIGLISMAAVIPGIAVGVLAEREWLEMVMMGVSLAVSAVPEGLPIVVTIALALGIRRMAGINVLVRRLSTAETLGGTDVICTDKTGTLTHNQMTIRQVYVPTKGVFQFSGSGYSTEGEVSIDSDFSSELGFEIGDLDSTVAKSVIESAVLCSDATLESGDPTERAFAVALEKLGEDSSAFHKKYVREDEIPFDSTEKFMAVTINRGEELTAIVKGAHSKVLGMCEGLSDEERDQVAMVNDRLAEQGLRVLAIAQKVVNGVAGMSEFSGYALLGLVAMEDPPRESVPDAIRVCLDAGVRVIMLTGDHRKTAEAIARQVGLLSGEGSSERLVVTGVELEKMNEQEFEEVVRNVNVFARVSPQHKLKVLEFLQRMGHTVGMTGDGVNDAPSVKKADIGMAVGAATDLTKGVSDMIILDNDFSTIPDGIREGRRIFFNIKKFVRLMISTNFDEIIVVLTSLLLNIPLPFLPLQLLWLNMATDALPALALTADVAEPDIMKQKPYDPRDQIIKGILPFSLFAALISVGATMGLYWLLYYYWGFTIEHTRTMVFTMMVMYELFLVFSIRSVHSAFSIGIFSNIYIWLSIAVAFLAQLLIIYHPLGQSVFKTASIGFTDWLMVIGFASSGFVIIELSKFVKYKMPTSVGKIIPIG